MKIIFLKDDRLREIITDRNKEIERLLLNGTLRGYLDVKLSTKEFKDGIYFGWEITDLENRETAKEEKIKPTGTMIPLVDWFKPIDQL